MSRTVVFVTGCSEGGIGYSLAEEFAARGCTTYATARSLEKMCGLPESIHKLVLDVTLDSSVNDAVSAIMREQGQIDILVNNAGISRVGPILDTPMEHIEQVFDTNVVALLRVCKAVAPHMVARKTGLIVNVGSVVGTFPPPWSSIYASSKSSVHALTQALAMELAPFKVHVMLVAPGAVKTNIAGDSLSRFSLPTDSLYVDYTEVIIGFALASQNTYGAYTPIEFSRPVVNMALKKRPPFFVSFAPGATVFRLFGWLPTALTRWILGRVMIRRSI